MATGATVYNIDIDLADADRQVYESISLRLARHPSESAEYLLTRVLAYALEFTEGLAFSTGGLSEPDEPAL
ncbi:MAG: YaeQ family protein, partial [Vicinamibacteria bacterium]|nr:YaeQ family protein [Vicinamibacteria bacterium]